MSSPFDLPAPEPAFNFLGSLMQAPTALVRQPIAPATRKRSFMDKLGELADALASAGGAEPGYGPARQAKAAAQKAEMVKIARQRLAQNPDDAEAYQFIFAENPAEAEAVRKAARGPQPELKIVGPDLIAVGPDLTAREVYRGRANTGSMPREVAIANLLADPNTPPAMRAQLERLVSTPVYQRDAAGNIVALPKAGEAPTDIESLWTRVLQQESGGRQLDAQGRPITSSAGAVGIAQVMPTTAPEAARLAGLPFDENRYRTDAQYNAALGRAYFNEMLRAFGDPARALAAYNAGPERVRRAIQQGGDNWLSLLPAETQQYVPAILGQRGAQTAVANPGFRRGEQNGIPGQFGPDNRFYPDPQPKGQGGGKNQTADAAQQLAVLDEGIADLDRALGLLRGGGNITGPLIGTVPDAALNFLNPETVTVGEAVARVSQKELRQILGGQFAAKEGEQLIKRAFNPGQSEQENIKRIESLRRQLVARRNSLAGGSSASQVVVTAPNGKSYTFPNEQAAQAFRQRAGIR